MTTAEIYLLLAAIVFGVATLFKVWNKPPMPPIDFLIPLGLCLMVIGFLVERH